MRDFAPDGSLRDLLVLETEEHDWRSIWKIFGSMTPLPTLTVGGDARPMPNDVQEAWRLAEKHHVVLAIPVGILSIHCHFFDQAEMEMDIDPGEVIGPEALQALADFMRIVGEATGKTVLLTHENSRDREIARFSTAAPAVVWTACRSRFRARSSS